MSQQTAADLEVAKVLLSELHFFLDAFQLFRGKAGADAVVGLAGALVGRGVEEEVVGHTVSVHGMLDLLPCLLSLLHPSQCLHSIIGFINMQAEKETRKVNAVRGACPDLGAAQAYHAGTLLLYQVLPLLIAFDDWPSVKSVSGS